MAKTQSECPVPERSPCRLIGVLHWLLWKLESLHTQHAPSALHDEDASFSNHQTDTPILEKHVIRPTAVEQSTPEVAKKKVLHEKPEFDDNNTTINHVASKVVPPLVNDFPALALSNSGDVCFT